MKAFQWAASAVAACSLFAGSYAIDVDPIVIKVGSLPREC